MKTNTKRLIAGSIKQYFSGFNTSRQFTTLLLTKELSKLENADYILTAIGTRGFAVTLRKEAKKHNVHLNKDSKPKPGDRIYVSISSTTNGLTDDAFKLLCNQCERLLDLGCIVIADNKQNATRSHNRLSEGALYEFLENAGYTVKENEVYAEWSFVPKILTHNGPGNSIEYFVQFTTDILKHYKEPPIIRALNKEIRFIGFLGVDIERINVALGNKLKYKEDGSAYYPVNDKYVKSESSIKTIVEYIRDKGVMV